MKVLVVCIVAVLACGTYGQEVQQGSDETLPLPGCNGDSCGKACWTSGWSGGRCQRNRCICYKAPRSENDVENHLENEIPVDEVEEATACDSSRCNGGCRAYGCSRGSCIGSTCRCSGCPGKEALTKVRFSLNVDAGVGAQVTECDPAICQRNCVRIGAYEGICLFGMCFCK